MSATVSPHWHPSPSEGVRLLHSQNSGREKRGQSHSRDGCESRTGGGQGGQASVPQQEDVQGGPAGGHEDLHQASLPAEEEEQGGSEAPAVPQLGQRPVHPGRVLVTVRGSVLAGIRGRHHGHHWQLQADILARYCHLLLLGTRNQSISMIQRISTNHRDSSIFQKESLFPIKLWIQLSQENSFALVDCGDCPVPRPALPAVTTPKHFPDCLVNYSSQLLAYIINKLCHYWPCVFALLVLCASTEPDAGIDDTVPTNDGADKEWVLN